MMLCCLFSQDKVYAEKYIDTKTAPAHIAVRVGALSPSPASGPTVCCHDDPMSDTTDMENTVHKKEYD